MICYDRLIRFCNKYESLYCYGAGLYGGTIHKILIKYDIHIKAFLVSECDEQSFKNNIPILRFDEITQNIDDNCGIILAISEEHQQEVISNINRICVKDEQIFFVKDKEFRNECRAELSDEELLNRFIIEDKKPVPDFCEDYNKLFSLKTGSYKQIDVQFVMMDQVGGCVNWIYYLKKRREQQNTAFLLLYPWTNLNRQGIRRDIYNLPNNYIITKMVSDGIEVVNRDTINFWHYCLLRFNDRFVINNGYVPELSSEICNGSYNKEVDYDDVCISLSDMEQRKGKEFLTQIHTNSFFCVSSRDSLYRRNIMGFDDPQLDIIDRYRNSDILTFEKTAKEFRIRYDLTAIRMGASFDTALPSNTSIIDYASKYRTEFLDVFLSSSCEFMIGDNSGILVFPLLFSKPIIIINNAVLTTKQDFLLPINKERDLMILQKYWDESKGRFLSIREMIETELYVAVTEPDAGRPAHTLLLYNERGIVPVKNTPDEIMEVSEEMLQRIKGVAKYDEIDIELQERYEEIKSEYHDEYFFKLRIGRDFLRENQWLLD